jgi:DNA-binding transcriptional ArsR family regulator
MGGPPRTQSREGASSADAVLRALADPHRRRILSLVKHEELAAGQIASHFEITQQAVSQHVQVLERAGLLSERREGARRLYTLRPESFEAVQAVLGELWPDALARLKTVVETQQRSDASDVAKPDSERRAS